MKHQILIVVEGGRIQDIFSDSEETCVLVKNFDDIEPPNLSGSTTNRWPTTIIDAQGLEAIAGAS